MFSAKKKSEKFGSKMEKFWQEKCFGNSKKYYQNEKYAAKNVIQTEIIFC